MPIPKTFGEMTESKYLKKEDIDEQGVVCRVSDFEKANLAMDNQPPEWKWVASLTGTDLAGNALKPMVLGPTNTELLKIATGATTPAETIGKRIVIYVDPTVAMRGKIVGGVRIRKITREDVAPPPPAEPPRRRSPGPIDDEVADAVSKHVSHADPEDFPDDVPF